MNGRIGPVSVVSSVETLPNQSLHEGKPATTGRHVFWALVQTAFGVGALAFVLRRVDSGKVFFLMKTADWRWIAGAVAVNFIMFVVLACRLWGLARVNVESTPFGGVLAAQIRSVFVNGFIPGSFGGEAVRFYSLQRFFRDKVLALTTLAVDRIVGTLVLFLTTGLALWWGATLVDSRQLGWAALLTGLPAVGMMVFFASRTVQGILLRGVELVGGVVPNGLAGAYRRVILGTVERFLFAARTFRTAPGPLAWAFVLSVVVRNLQVLAPVCIALALGMKASWGVLFAAVSLVEIGRILPVTPPNGVGVREALLVFFLTRTGIGGEAALGLALLVTGVMYLCTAVCGIVAVCLSLVAARHSSQASPT